MTPTRGDIVRRGDTGGYGIVVTNDMLHQVSEVVILCTVVRSTSMADSFPHAIEIAAADQNLYAIPVSVHTAPASAITEIIGQAEEHQLRDIVRMLHAATSP
ncbi:hypothetical protein [Glycomyces buryatensis]|uniref:Type II toxin-antitoxin system PemK/MazF family toxin n=1 Tax=Glycomyces buryatensis TaxID=2570927 RepID=A0A4S8QAD6_9ACTN|nr:hypothetical protein [Glycomyces buryatensis]THV41230.1 hypothetical protein FAB82_12405 [Glycomyces buryatensis]